MKVEKFQANRGRVVLAHMVMSTSVLSRVASRWEQSGLFASTWENLVATWCLDYYKLHGKAPRKGIRSLYEDWAESSHDAESPKLVERFLAYVSSEYESSGKLTTNHVLDIAGNHFSRVKAERLKEEIEANLEAGHLKKIDKAVQAYNRVELGQGSYVDPFTDESVVTQAFSQEAYEPMLVFNNPLDRFFVHMLKRHAFIAFQAPEKTGKSYWLSEIAYLSLLQRRNVAFFAIGDLSQEEMVVRLGERVAQHPINSDSGKWPHKIRIPISIDRPSESSEDKLPVVKYKTVTFDSPLTGKGAIEAYKNITEKKIKSKRSLFRMSCHPADSIHVMDIRDKLREWATNGWAVDTVVIDYADILAPFPGFWKDERESTNASWKRLKALAQELHCLVVTATQADSGSYDRRSQTRKNFSTDKRKYAHTDGICAINVTEAEREIGCMRLAWLAKRRGRYSMRRECYVAGNLAVASPAMAAVF